MRILLLLLPAILSGQQLFQVTPALNYYVDSVNGSDANPPGLPYLTVAHLTTIDAAYPRPVWNFRYDSMWREQATMPRDNMTANGYGPGTNQPMLAADALIVNATFTQPRGPGTCWQITGTTAWTAGTTGRVNLYRNGSVMQRATSLANCDATQDRMFVSSDASATPTIYVNPPGGVDPTTDGATYEYSSLLMGISAMQSGPMIRNISARRNFNQTGSIECGIHCTVQGSTALDGNVHGMLIGEYSAVYDSTVHNIYDPVEGGTLFICSTQAAAGGPCLFVRDHAIQDASVPATAFTNSAFYAHVASGTPFSEIRYDSCTSLGSPVSYDGLAVVMNVINSTGDGAIAASSTTNNISGVSITTSAPKIVSASNVGTTTNIDLSTLIGTAASATGVFIESGNLSLTNSTVTTNNNGFAVNMHGTAGSFTSLGNHINATQFTLYNLATIPTPVLNSDFNIFTTSFAAPMTLIGVNHTIAFWKLTYGQDANSTP